MGAIDRLIRLVVALLVVIAYYLDVITGTFGIILLIASAVFVLTSLISFCPLYKIFGISSCPVKKQK